MARDKKTSPPQSIDTSNLPDLDPQEYDFIHYLMFDASCEGFAASAYKKAFPNKKLTDGSLYTAASKLRNRSDVQIWIKAMRQANMDRLVCSKEEHLAELASIRDEARAAGNYGATIQAELGRGKVAGHHVERKEDVNRTRDQLTSLTKIADSLGREKALDMAALCGIRDEFERHLETRH